MFAANAQLDVRPGRAAAGCGQLNQLADTFDIKTDEWIARKDPLLDIGAQKLARIIARNP